MADKHSRANSSALQCRAARCYEQRGPVLTWPNQLFPSAMGTRPRHVAFLTPKTGVRRKDAMAMPPRTGGGGGGLARGHGFGLFAFGGAFGLSPLHILTLCGSERVWVVSTEPPDDLFCLTSPGVGRPGDGAVAHAVDQVHPDAQSESMRGYTDTNKEPLGPGPSSSSGRRGQGATHRLHPPPPPPLTPSPQQHVNPAPYPPGQDEHVALGPSGATKV